jgi:hypothetical protein
VGTAIVDLGLAVSGNTLTLIVPFLHEPTDSPLNELRKIPIDKSRVLPSKLHLTGEAEIVANEY